MVIKLCTVVLREQQLAHRDSSVILITISSVKPYEFEVIHSLNMISHIYLCKTGFGETYCKKKEILYYDYDSTDNKIDGIINSGVPLCNVICHFWKWSS